VNYATLADLIAQFGDREVVAIADRNRDGVVDQPIVDGAVQRASTKIDSYLAARYALPLTTVPAVLVEVCCDIARYNLCGAEVTETDVVRLRYKDAIKTLEQIRSGTLDVGLTAAGQVVSDIPSVRVIGGSRAFSRGSLGDY
jgi:phage gp36-like protein